MTALTAQPARAIRVDLTLPVTRIGAGAFAFDPLAQLIGAPIEDLLSSLMVGGVHRRTTPTGGAVEVYPLALPDGEGASIPLGSWGAFGFQNQRGQLMITVPAIAARWVEAHLGAAVVDGPEGALSMDGRARVLRYVVDVRPGMAARFPLGLMGEVGIVVR